MAAASFLIGGLALAAAAPAESSASLCRCDDYATELARLQQIFASRGAGADVPLTRSARTVFGTRVNQAYTLAACLARCDNVPDRDHNAARRILAAAAYKSRDLGLPDAEVRHRLSLARKEAWHCLTLEPNDPECLTWHASIRGRLAQYSWSLLLLTLPRSLLAEFRAARGNLAPGRDLRDAAATRGEASILLETPGILGGDPLAARMLMEVAAHAPRFPCSISNRTLLAETRTRTGDAARGLAELRATVAAGLPSCARQRYENASAFEEAERCLARVEADPTLLETWPDACD